MKVDIAVYLVVMIISVEVDIAVYLSIMIISD